MAEYSGSWPAEPWRLTAPESYVLYRGDSPPGSDTLKLALKELVVRRALRIERLDGRGRLGRKKSVDVLRAGSRSTAIPEEPPLAVVMELYERAEEGDRGGVVVERFADAAKQRFGRSLAGYVNDHVFPAMEQRGLLRSERTRSRGLRTRRRWVLTAAGREAADQLDKWVNLGHQGMRGWVRDDPAVGQAYTHAAGAAVLLMSSLYPQLDRLARQPGLGDGFAPATASGGPADLSDDGGAFDFGGLGDGFEGLDGIGDAFGAIDIGIGIGDGGGGGGGGDGGGGGGG